MTTDFFGDFADPGTPGGMLVQLYLWISPLLVVHLVGIVLALVALRNRARRPAAALLALGLGLLTVTLLARPLLNYVIVTSSSMSFEEHRRWVAAFGVADQAIDGIAIILLIIAALGWRRGDALPVASGVVVSLAHHPPSATMPPLSATIRLTLILVPYVLSVLASGAGILFAQRRRTEEIAFVLIGAALVLVVLGTIAFAMTLHALWKTIQPPPRAVGVEGIARTSPAKAVGFLFIPLFNFYWIFQAWVGLATDTNRTLEARGIAAVPVSRGLAITVCVISVLSIVPVVGVLGSLVNLVAFPIFLAGAIRAANALRTATGSVT